MSRIRYSASVLSVLYDTSRRADRDRYAKRYFDASIRESVAKGLAVVTESLGDPDRDYADEEAKALAAQREREAALVEEQRQRE